MDGHNLSPGTTPSIVQVLGGRHWSQMNSSLPRASPFEGQVQSTTQGKQGAPELRTTRAPGRPGEGPPPRSQGRRVPQRCPLLDTSARARPAGYSPVLDGTATPCLLQSEAPLRRDCTPSPQSAKQLPRRGGSGSISKPTFKQRELVKGDMGQLALLGPRDGGCLTSPNCASPWGDLTPQLQHLLQAPSLRVAREPEPGWTQRTQHMAVPQPPGVPSSSR